jgi:hypothetical protein
MDEAAGMMALHAAMKAELGEDGLPVGGGAEVAPAEAARPPNNPHLGRLKCLQESVPDVKAEVKIEFGIDEVNVKIKLDSTCAAVSRPPGATVHDLTGGVADVRDWRRVQPTRGTKRRAVSYAAVHSGSDSADEEWVSAVPRRRRRKVARVMQVTTGVVGRSVPPEEDVVWEQRLASLRAYKCRHGDCNVPLGWAEDPALGRWVGKQRGEPCRGMTAARTMKLEALGFAWERLGAGWEAQVAKLKAYKQRHGDCNVPGVWAEDPPLGRWVREQRTCKKALERGEPSRGMTAARAAKLEAIGFAWEMSAAAISKQRSEGNRDHGGWEAQLVKLNVYKRIHGDCNVPWGWAEDKPLGRWVDNQRQYKKQLDRGEPCRGMTAARTMKLEALGFEWERLGAGWEAQVAKLKAYKQRHGDCNVPQAWAEDPPLGRWVREQRTHNKALERGEPSKGMTAARAVKLEALGFTWELSPRKGGRDDAGWEAQLAKLKQYKRKHGDCNVPQGWAEHKPLGKWVNKQRHYKKKLDCGEPSEGMTAARVAKLDALGFAWKMSKR